jgi:hypothetical protein
LPCKYPGMNLRTTTIYDGLRSQLFALGLLTPTRRASARSFGASNSFNWNGLNGAQDRNRTAAGLVPAKWLAPAKWHLSVPAKWLAPIGGRIPMNIRFTRQQGWRAGRDAARRPGS